ncbi:MULTISPECIES: DUF262 domain-containing protein [Pseudomonas]|uniref:GmrSD restriction endonucleases N-terminal domain-containing protein n=2 Tax=Pseudomonas TaxID=286 RepID=I4K8V9_9PSED|nr:MULTISPECIES: DUF262 domain-containing protein [Pseudomonas]EIK61149.1 protein of unknown function, DUF262 family [Pseudomonas lactis]PKH21521.1 DUF262 domain-containing protein [Pseudomonas fluorescens]
MTVNIQEDLADEGVGSGVEREQEGNQFKTGEPFDPASISLSSKIVALDTVLRRIRNHTITLAPNFQRNFVWDTKRKSLLIESMMLRIPLPMFYVSEDKDGVWEVVDGLQRLTTIKDFILGEDGDGKGFKLKGLEFWGESFDGKDFYTINRKLDAARIINNVMEAELSFTIINPDTPEKVKRNIFKRINTGGMRLSTQEIRHALYQGEASDLLRELVDNSVYQRVVGKTVKDDRMAGRELVLRFISFYLRKREDFKGDMDEFLADTMRHVNNEHTIPLRIRYDKIQLTEAFKRALNRSDSLFGEHAFRRSHENRRKTPVNKSLFEMWTVLLARINQPTFESIIADKQHFLLKYHKMLDDDAFADAIGKYGSDPAGVRDRYSRAITLLKEYQRA